MTMQGFFARFWHMLVVQVHGPMHLRFIMQPILGFIIAFRHGSSDARAGRPPYFFWAVFTDPMRRPHLLRQAWHHVGRLFLSAITLDAIYQFIVYRWIYPTQALITAAVLAFVPYLLLRGMVTRVMESTQFRKLEG